MTPEQLKKLTSALKRAYPHHAQCATLIVRWARRYETEPEELDAAGREIDGTAGLQLPIAKAVFLAIGDDGANVLRAAAISIRTNTPIPPCFAPKSRVS
jgi:hypothetical protein